MISFTIENKKIQVWPSKAANQPVIYFNTFSEEGEQVLSLLKDSSDMTRKNHDFTLAAVSNLDWDHDMSPWDIPPIFKGDTPCTGSADDYLNLLTRKILPETEKHIKGSIAWRGLAGYSLAGLFAVYAMYQTEAFTRIASISGSLWFPGIIEYIHTHEFKQKPDCIYLSLGNKEAKTQNSYLKSVIQNTEEIYKSYQKQGINTTFVLNPGNHFKDTAERSAKGIKWMMEQ